MGTKREPGTDEDGAGPSNKSARIHHPRAGTVVKVIVHNFMTYSKCEINPGNRLNLVLGANGTGKSSFVCALCVGLAGSTRLLGRADSVKEFIRSGQSEGSVEVWLARENGKIVKIYRKLIDDGKTGKSEWKMNGKPSTATKVKDLVSAYNVQLDNLCQFLPQDKVVEFAKLKPHELLTETEKALGDSHLHDLHKELIETHKGLKTNQTTLASYEKQLADLREKNTGMERDVERFNKRQALLDKVHLRNLKRPWLEYHVARDKLATLKARHKELEAKFKTAEAELKEAEAPLRDAQARTKKCSAEKRRFQSDAAGREADRGRVEAEITAETDKVDELTEALNHLAEQSETRKQKIAKYEERLEAAEAEIAKISEEVGSQGFDEAAEAKISKERQELDRQRRTLSAEVRELKGETQVPRSNIDHFRNKIKKLDDHKRQRLNTLEKHSPGITKLWEWIQNNPGAFRGKVVGPVLTEVSTRDPTMAAFLEMQVSMKVWRSFLTEYPEDQKLLVDMIPKVTGQSRHNLVVTNYAANPDEPLRHRSGRAEEYAEHGITATLDMALKDTPAIVAHVLDDEAAITSAFVGSEKLKGSYQSFLDQNQKIRTLYLPDIRISVSTSRYNAAAKSKELVSIKPSSLLSGGVDASEREEMEQNLRAAEEKLHAIEMDVEAKEAEEREADKLHKMKDNEVRKIQAEKKKVAERKRTVQMNVATCKKNLQMAQKAKEPMEKEPKLRKELTKHLANIEIKVLEYRDHILAMAHSLQRMASAELAAEEAKIVEASIAHTNAAKQEEVNALRTQAEDAKFLREEAKEATKKAQAVAQREAPQPDDAEERAAMLAKFDELTQDLETLVDEIDSLSAEADAIVCSNPQVLEQYKTRLAKIEDLEVKVQSERAVVDGGNGKIEELKGKWLPELEKLVEKINVSFRVNFAEIGCAGEVKLHIDDDFEKCEVQIRVKFRDEEELQVLTASRQSGGERSVCTILYLIALQGITDCPFRVVDEINQGMDPINERKVFNQLVQCACLPDTPQTFLLTPKLLPDLPFSEDVRVLNIFNGPWVNEVAQTFTVEDLLPAQRA